MTTIYTSGFDVMKNYFDGGSKMNSITLTDDQVQYNSGDITIIIGTKSLRMVMLDNAKFASITMIPVALQAGKLELSCETTLALYSTDFRKTFSGLYMDGGEAFQINTLYDFDFSILKDIAPKYLEVLKSMKECKFVQDKVHTETLSSAIESVEKYNKMYAEE